jgi:hypothetical protein
MSKYIPNLMKNRIEKKSFLDPLIEKKQPKHPYQIEQEKQDAERDRIEEAIKTCCSVFKATRPAEWKAFEENMTILYGYLRVANRRSPEDFMGINLDKGISIDATYWSLVKAHTDGQLQILDNMFETFPITAQDVVEFDKSKTAPKSFFKKVLHFLKDLM